MLPADHFLSQVVEEALLKVHRTGPYKWHGNYIEMRLSEPFGDTQEDDEDIEDDDGPDDEVDIQQSASDTDGIINTSLRFSETNYNSSSQPAGLALTTSVPNQPARESFGVLLSQVFLVLSVLSKDERYLKLPALSNLHRFPIIGQGNSFIARKVPRTSLPGLPETHHVQHQVFAYKSLRHYNGSDKDATKRRSSSARHRAASARLKNVLSEIQILTHPPLASHSNIIGLIGYGWEVNRIDRKSHVFHWPFLVLEYAAYGSMIDAFEQHVIGHDARLSLCLDVGHALVALHGSEVVHGDVKLENILVFPDKKKGVIAKLADFGFALVDLEGKAPRSMLPGRSEPWNAPESQKRMPFAELYLTDIYSFGFLIWRTMCYGHEPFTENDGRLSLDGLARISRLKESQLLLDEAFTSMQQIRFPDSLYGRLKTALLCTLQLDPAQRNIAACITALGGSVPTSNTGIPLRRAIIPPEVHGLGIYSYAHHNLRLDCQLRHALESYCLSPATNNWESSRHLVDNGASTLFSNYLELHASGDLWDSYHEMPTKILGLSWLLVSAGSGQTSSAEAIFSLCSTFMPDGWNEWLPDSEVLRMAAAYGLTEGSEFILKDVLEQPVPRKDEFLDHFRTRLCRGAGIILGVPKGAFDGTGEENFRQYLGKKFYKPNTGQEGEITADHLFRIAAAWGCLESVQTITTHYKVNFNSQDQYGETALLKACRAGHNKLVHWLVRSGKARASIASKKGITPLHWLTSFDDSEIFEIAFLLKNAGADPNQIAVDSNEDQVEQNYFFFKGPPILRAVASGQEIAVKALLDLGADPKLRSATKENALILAARRLRLNILKMLVEKAGAGCIWERTVDWRPLVTYIIECSPVYSAKIHGPKYVEAHLETFKYAWSKTAAPGRFFKAITKEGFTPLQVAVHEGNKVVAEEIVRSCPSEGHLKELLVTIGLQASILYGRQSMFCYFLEHGAQPLHPYLVSDPNTDLQFQDYVLYGPWTMNLAQHQYRTTSLHLCAQAGDLSAFFGLQLLKALLPASRWDTTPSTLRKQDIVNCKCSSLPVDDPIIDGKNEFGETAFFCALKAEEYQLAWQLYEAGANHNAVVPHPVVHLSGPAPPIAQQGLGLPIAELALTWISAHRAIHFLIHDCWGCLRLTNTYGDELITGVIEETAGWPIEEASTVLEYVIDRAYPQRFFDSDLLIAIGCQNEAAVATFVRLQDRLRQHGKPRDLYDAVRKHLLKFCTSEPKETSDASAVLQHRQKRFAWYSKASRILEVIHDAYPDEPVGGTALPGFPNIVAAVVLPELNISKRRYMSGAIGASKLVNEVDGILKPWLAVLSARGTPAQLDLMEAFLENAMGKTVAVEWRLERGGEGLDRSRTRVKRVAAERISHPKSKVDVGALQKRIKGMFLRKRHSVEPAAVQPALVQAAAVEPELTCCSFS
ncbi:MAG: hypothetical protein M1837_002008 [Sclerophora amabilis]|nr:MAG: hypothetical protein M1837_002008 [Sclerophora amabilis]